MQSPWDVTRLPRPALAVLAAILMVAGLSIGLGALAAAPARAADDDAVQRFGGCLASGAEGDLLIVMDTSTSLTRTDPGAARVRAATYLIDQLARYADQSGAKLSVAVAGFSDRLKVSQGWISLRGSSSGELSGKLHEAVNAYRDQNNGFETDYWTAADGARGYLADRAKVGARHCQAWVWFSDGKFDLDKRDTAAERKAYGVTKPYGPSDTKLTSIGNERALERAGRADLCRVGGVADQLRAQGVTTFAVGLKATGDRAADFALMQGVATGSAVDGKRCGRAPAQPSGQFVLADHIDDLLLAFDVISDPAHPPIRQQTPLCQGAVCARGTHRFVLDPSISRVHILASTEVANYRAILTGPIESQRITLGPRQRATTKSFPGFTAASTSLSGQTVQIDIARRTDRGWVGQWSLAFVDPASTGRGVARSNIHLYGDIRPAWLRPLSTITTGTSVTVRLGLVRAGGGTGPLDPSTITSKVSMDASLVYPGGDSVSLATRLTKARLATPVRLTVPAGSTGDARVHLTLRVTTAAVRDARGRTIQGTALEPQSVDYPVTISLPAAFPKVPSTINFGTTEKAGDHAATLPVTGKGCVWLKGPADSRTGPDGVSVAVTSTASSTGHCVGGSLPLHLRTDQIGTGLASGELTVMTRPADASAAPQPVRVRYELTMRKPRNDAVFWPLFGAIVLAGLLIPVGLLYLVKWRTAQIPGSSLLIGSVHGLVDQRSSFLTTATLTERAMRGVTLVGTDRRRIVLNSQSELRTKMGLGLTEPGYAVVAGQASASSAHPPTARGGTVARLPLAVHDRWVVLLDSADPHAGPVEVVLLVAPTSGKLAELLADARNRVPDVTAQLRAEWGPPGPPAAGPPPPGGTPSRLDDW